MLNFFLYRHSRNGIIFNYWRPCLNTTILLLSFVKRASSYKSSRQEATIIYKNMWWFPRHRCHHITSWLWFQRKRAFFESKIYLRVCDTSLRRFHDRCFVISSSVTSTFLQPVGSSIRSRDCDDFVLATHSCNKILVVCHLSKSNGCRRVLA